MTDDEINNLLDQTTFKKYTRDQAFEALKICSEKGLLEAERQTGIPRRNITNWKNPGRNSQYCKANTKRHYDAYQQKWVERYKNNPQKIKNIINKSKQKQGYDGIIKRREYARDENIANLQPLQKNLAKGNKIIGKTLGIIACSKRKKDYKCTVNEMYSDSTFFNTFKTYCLQNYHNCKVLSAKHGLLDLLETIEPYESITLSECFDRKDTKVMSHPDRRVWALKVYNSFDWRSYEEIHFHMSKHYWRYLEPLFTNHKNIFYHPMDAGLGINMQKIQKQIS